MPEHGALWWPDLETRFRDKQEEKAHSTAKTSVSSHTPNITTKSTPAPDKKQIIYTVKNNLNRTLMSESLSRSTLRKTRL